MSNKRERITTALFDRAIQEVESELLNDAELQVKFNDLEKRRNKIIDMLPHESKRLLEDYDDMKFQEETRKYEKIYVKGMADFGSLVSELGVLEG